MIRHTPLRRTPMKKSARRKGDRPDVRDAYMSERDRCELCWARRDSFMLNRRVVLHCHHVIGGTSGRLDVSWNLCALCERCHAHYHDGGGFDSAGKRLPELNRGVILAVKAEGPDFVLARYLILAHRHSLPASWGAVEIPVAFVEERRRNSQ